MLLGPEPLIQWVALLSSGLAIGGCGGAEDNPSPDSSGAACAPGEAHQAIVAGVEDEEDPAVVSVNILQAECTRAGDSICTGTLVGPRHVLTAAHCALPPAPSMYGVLFGTQGSAGEGPLGYGLEGSFFRVASIRLHPDFDEATLDNDVAVLVLEAEPPIKALSLLAGALSNELDGQEARVVGFGLTADQGDTSRRKRSGTVTVERVDDATFRYLPSPSMTCEGDSGGPVLLRDGARDVLIGVTSRGDASCREHGTAIRVDRIPDGWFDP